jgi:rsbT co-antagonist protein RsbR
MQNSINTLDAFFAQTPDRLFIADASGKLLQWSKALAGEVELTEGVTLLDLAHPEDRATLSERWSNVRESDVALVASCRLRTTGGAYGPFTIEARSASAGGQVCGSIRAIPTDGSGFVKAGKVLEAIFENLPISVWAVDPQGTFILHEGKAIQAAGLKPKQYVGQNVFELYGASEGNDRIRRTMAGETHHFANEAHGVAWEHWTVPTWNDRGEVDVVVGVSLDVTASKRVEKELSAKLEAIEAQKQIIRSLATPIIQVWDGVLTMPLVGVVDSMRAAEVMDGLLNEVVRSRARFAVLDVTGVDVMDTATAGHLLRLIRSIRLLGAEGIITGIRPSIAQTMVGIGVEMTSIVTLRSLREGLQYCIVRMAEEQAGASDSE